MKNKAHKIVDKFYKFFEMNVFDPENIQHKKIVQNRINKMMQTELMNKWLKENNIPEDVYAHSIPRRSAILKNGSSISIPEKKDYYIKIFLSLSTLERLYH